MAVLLNYEETLESSCGSVCICHGVTLTRDQWMVVRTFLLARDDVIIDAYGKLTLKRPGDRGIPCTDAEYDDLRAKLDRGTPKGDGGLHWCPLHRTRALPDESTEGT